MRRRARHTRRWNSVAVRRDRLVVERSRVAGEIAAQACAGTGGRRGSDALRTDRSRACDLGGGAPRRATSCRRTRGPRGGRSRRTGPRVRSGCSPRRGPEPSVPFFIVLSPFACKCGAGRGAAAEFQIATAAYARHGLQRSPRARTSRTSGRARIRRSRASVAGRDLPPGTRRARRARAARSRAPSSRRCRAARRSFASSSSSPPAAASRSNAPPANGGRERAHAARTRAGQAEQLEVGLGERARLGKRWVRQGLGVLRANAPAPRDDAPENRAGRGHRDLLADDRPHAHFERVPRDRETHAGTARRSRSQGSRRSAAAMPAASASRSNARVMRPTSRVTEPGCGGASVTRRPPSAGFDADDHRGRRRVRRSAASSSRPRPRRPEIARAANHSSVGAASNGPRARSVSVRPAPPGPRRAGRFGTHRACRPAAERAAQLVTQPSRTAEARRERDRLDRLDAFLDQAPREMGASREGHRERPGAEARHEELSQPARRHADAAGKRHDRTFVERAGIDQSQRARDESPRSRRPRPSRVRSRAGSGGTGGNRRARRPRRSGRTSRCVAPACARGIRGGSRSRSCAPPCRTGPRSGGRAQSRRASSAPHRGAARIGCIAKVEVRFHVTQYARASGLAAGRKRK